MLEIEKEREREGEFMLNFANLNGFWLFKMQQVGQSGGKIWALIKNCTKISENVEKA